MAWSSFAAPCPLSAERSAEPPGEKPARSSIEVDAARPLAEAVRELSRRHGLVITYEDPLWAHDSEVVDATAQIPGAEERLAQGEIRRRFLQPRRSRLVFEYGAPDLGVDAGAAAPILDELVDAKASSELPGWFAVRRHEDVFHVVPTQRLDAAGRQVEHASPLDLPIHFPPARRSILDTLEVIVEAVTEVSETPVTLGLVLIEPFERLALELGSDGRPARQLLLEAMQVEGLRTSWLMFYDPRLETYFFNVYPVRAAAWEG